MVCNPIAVNKKGQVLQEIISLHQSFTRRRSRSSLKSDTSILNRSSYRDSPIPPEGRFSLQMAISLKEFAYTCIYDQILVASSIMKLLFCLMFHKTDVKKKMLIYIQDAIPICLLLNKEFFCFQLWSAYGER